jgi:hypothetical protein
MQITKELLAWIEANQSEGHLHKRLSLSRTALDKSGSPELSVFEGAAMGYYSDEKAVRLFDAVAKGGPEGIEAHAALCLLAAMLLDQVLPPKLAAHASKVLFGHAAVIDGRHYKTATRDLALIARINELCSKHSIPATHGDAHADVADAERSDKVSGCSLAAQEFVMTVRAAEEVWRKRREFGFE